MSRPLSRFRLPHVPDEDRATFVAIALVFAVVFGIAYFTK